MGEERGIGATNTAQLPLRSTLRKPIFAAHPLDESRLKHTPQLVAEISIPELAVVVDPATKRRVVALRQFPETRT